MAPSVELTPSTFTRLQAHAVPLVDTIESVVSRLLDAYETRVGAPAAGADGGDGDSDNIRQFNPFAPPSLTHTKVLAMELDGTPLQRNQVTWNGLLDAAVRLAKARAKSPAEFHKLMIINMAHSKKTDEGYRFLSDIGLSVQGQDANGAWKAAAYIAKHLGCSLKATFAWRHKDGAAFPGVTGQFTIAGR